MSATALAQALRDPYEANGYALCADGCGSWTVPADRWNTMPATEQLEAMDDGFVCRTWPSPTSPYDGFCRFCAARARSGEEEDFFRLPEYARPAFALSRPAFEAKMMLRDAVLESLAVGRAVEVAADLHGVSTYTVREIRNHPETWPGEVYHARYRQRQRVFAYLRENPTATDWEAAKALGISMTAVEYARLEDPEAWS